MLAGRLALRAGTVTTSSCVRVRRIGALLAFVAAA
jgi:hypothetical protein